MSILIPVVDDTGYKALLDEALRRIPAHAPEWTDFNQSDPGVALLQLFAWIADTYRCRLDGIPESHRPSLQRFAELLRRRRCSRAITIAGSTKARSTLAGFIAGKVGLSLYRVDLEAVVSKYIGETGKNLRRVFDAAEDAGSILFFDEAYGLFGKRTEMTDAHNRYANIEIDRLLERLEESKGVVILAGGNPENFDTAFSRRFRWSFSLCKKEPNQAGIRRRRTP